MQVTWGPSKIFSTPTQIVIAGIVGVLLGVLFIFLPALAVVGLVIGLALTLLAINRPELALLALFLMLSSIFPDTLFPRIDLIVARFYITDFIIVLFIALILMRWMADRNYRLADTPIDIPLLLFVLWGVVTALRGYWVDDVDSRRMVAELRIVVYYLIFYMFTNLLRTRGSVTFIIRTFFFLATLVSISMLVQYVFGTSVTFLAGRVETLATQGETYSQVTRITDTVGEGLVTTAFILKTVMIFIDRLRVRKITDLLQWGIIGIGFIMTFNRTHWLMALFVVGMTALVVSRQERQKIVYWSLIIGFLGLFLIGALLIMFPNSGASNFILASSDRILSVTSSDLYREGTTSTLLWRNFEYDYGFPQIWAKPITGIGLGALYRPFVASIDHAWFDGRHYSHNGLMWIAIKTGIVGFSLFLWLSIAFIWHALKNWRNIQDITYRGMVLGSALGFLSILIGSIAHPIPMTLYWIPVLMFMMGVSEVILLRFSAQAQQ